ncbi:MAG: LysM peptidoglycan-binding domain-containing protein [Chloroflexi bacterium]|nr:LysM peptidoglycan-binding domain-containing protein [Chloroflexota bacterium]
MVHKGWWGGLLVLALFLCLAPAVAASSGETYIVRPGDTLIRIASRYQVSVEELARANRLSDPDLIVVGQRLIIPGTASSPMVPISGTLPYRVQPGDTLSILAQRFGTTVEAISEANGLEDPDLIVVGQLLSVPTVLADEAPLLPKGPITAVRVDPAVAEQGQTLFVRVRLATSSALTVTFEGAPVLMVADEDGYWGVAPVGALMAPGRKSLRVRVASGGEVTEIEWPVWIVQGDYDVQHVVLPPAKGDLLDPQKLRAEREKLAEVWADTVDRPLWEGPFVTPLPPRFVTSSPFGTRRSYNGGPVSSYHEGHDFAAPEGTPVVAPAAGRVVLAEPLAVRGNAVAIDHGLGVHTGYWHLSSIDVKPGQRVQVGDVIGRVGTTGLSTGAHLHWELRIGDVPVDPLTWTRRSFP